MFLRRMAVCCCVINCTNRFQWDSGTKANGFDKCYTTWELGTFPIRASLLHAFPIRSVNLKFYVVMAFLNFLHVTHLYARIKRICCSCHSGKTSDARNTRRKNRSRIKWKRGRGPPISHANPSLHTLYPAPRTWWLVIEGKIKTLEYFQAQPCVTSK